MRQPETPHKHPAGTAGARMLRPLSGYHETMTEDTLMKSATHSRRHVKKSIQSSKRHTKILRCTYESPEKADTQPGHGTESAGGPGETLPLESRNRHINTLTTGTPSGDGQMLCRIEHGGKCGMQDSLYARDRHIRDFAENICSGKKLPGDKFTCGQ